MTPASSGRMAGRVCVVTGAARGIGLAIATRFAAEGGRIACVDVSARRLEPAVAAIAGSGADARAYAVDVARRSEAVPFRVLVDYMHYYSPQDRAASVSMQATGTGIPCCLRRRSD